MVNRITQQILNRNQLNEIRNHQNQIFNAQRQVSTGLRYEKPSQDPLAATVALDLKQAINFQNQLESNAQTAEDFNYAAETELKSAEEVFQRVRELSIRAASEALNEQQLGGLTAELDSLLERLTDIANGTHEGRFIFGGYQTQRPPFTARKDLVLEGTQLSNLGLASGSFETQVETRSATTVQAGAFALNGGDLVINGVDMGSFFVNDPARTAAVNAQTLVERINTKTKETGVSARAVTIPGGTFNAPGGGPLTGVALSNINAQNELNTQGIQVGGRGIRGVGNLNVFRNEKIDLADTRFLSERVAAGAIGDVPAGTVQVNGVTINSPMTFVAANSPEQNAQEIARAINTASAQSEVYAETDGQGFVRLRSQKPFTIAGAPAQINLPNQLYQQGRNSAASTAAVTTGGALTLASGALMLNGIDIFAQSVQLTATMTAQERADAVVRAVNGRATETGVTASRDTNGQVFFSNGDFEITSVAYRGDAGDNQAQIGRDSLIDLTLSGDQAFAGNRNQIVLASRFDLPAVGLGSAISGAPVSFQAGDDLAAGEFQLNGTDILVPGPFTGVAAADANTLVNAINAQTGTTGVTAQLSGGNQVQLLSNSGNAFTLATAGDGVDAQIPAGSYLNAIEAGDFFINGVDIGPIPAVPANPGNPVQNSQDLATALANAINAKAAVSGVSAEIARDNLGNVRLELQTKGQDIEITSNDPLPANLLNATGIAVGTKVNQKIDAFDAIIRLREQVSNSRGSSTAANISQQNIKDISDALDLMVANQVELGVRGQRAELVKNRVLLNREILQTQLAKNQGVDLTEAILKFQREEQALQASYSVTQRINSLSLLNFI